MSSLVSMPDPSMAESPLDFEEGINECGMFSSALDSAVLSDSGHSSCDEQSSDPACDADDASEVPDLRIVELGVRRSSRTTRLRIGEYGLRGSSSSTSSHTERDMAQVQPVAAPPAVPPEQRTAEALQERLARMFLMVRTGPVVSHDDMAPASASLGYIIDVNRAVRAFWSAHAAEIKRGMGHRCLRGS